jgi:flagellar hook protein FlgE
MFPSLNTAVSALQQFQDDIDVIGNNMANVNTTGFKDGTMNFADTLSQVVDVGGPSSAQIGTGVTTDSITNNFGQGTISQTAVSSDLAISGNGFFIVKDPVSGSEYVTRAGDFQVDQNGYLVTADGMRVQGYSDAGLTTLGDIQINANGAPATAAPGATVQSYSIGQNGDLTVTLSDGTQFVRGEVLLQNYSNPNALLKQGKNLYTAPPTAGGLAAPVAPDSAGLGTIQSGALEMSNVDLTTEMTNLIAAERAFESNAKIVTTSDEVLQDLVNLKR